MFTPLLALLCGNALITARAMEAIPTKAPTPTVRFDLGGYQENWFCPFCGAANAYEFWGEGRVFWCDSCNLVGFLAADPPNTLLGESICTEHFSCADFTARSTDNGDDISDGPFMYSMGPIVLLPVKGPATVYCLATRDGTRESWSGH